MLLDSRLSLARARRSSFQRQHRRASELQALLVVHAGDLVVRPRVNVHGFLLRFARHAPVVAGGAEARLDGRLRTAEGRTTVVRTATEVALARVPRPWTAAGGERGPPAPARRHQAARAARLAAARSQPRRPARSARGRPLGRGAASVRCEQHPGLRLEATTASRRGGAGHRRRARHRAARLPSLRPARRGRRRRVRAARGRRHGRGRGRVVRRGRSDALARARPLAGTGSRRPGAGLRPGRDHTPRGPSACRRWRPASRRCWPSVARPRRWESYRRWWHCIRWTSGCAHS